MVLDGARPARRAATAAVLLGAVALALLGMEDGDDAATATQVEPTFVRAERNGDSWEVLRSDGAKVALDPEVELTGVTLGLSPDGRWLSWAHGPQSGGILSLQLLRVDRSDLPTTVSAATTTAGFAHRWSPDSRLVLVPVPDGDVQVVDTRAGLVGHWFAPGTIAGFVDDDSVGWVHALGLRGDAGLEWLVTDLEGRVEHRVGLQVDRTVLAPPGWAQLFLRLASVAPDGSSIAVVLTDHRDRGLLLTFSTADGALLHRVDVSAVPTDLACPLRWDGGRPVPTAREEPCTVRPG